ncbi:MAG: hypothetical protein JKX73_04020 [Flavobacteriales bacterium]|nr:hypothetical protein [Flavobacteriales bacterium]
MKLSILYLVIVFTYVFHSPGRAQLYNFKSYTVEEGLSQSQVNTIFEDSRGYLWLGTAGGGLCQFDGTNFTQYGEKDGLCGPIVTSIVEDKNGNMWIGATWGGISRFNGKKFQNFKRREGLLAEATSAMIIDREGNIIVGSSAGVSILNKNYEFTHLNTLNGLIGAVTCLYEMHNGAIWIGTVNGLYIYQDGQLTKVGRTEGLPYDHVTSMTQDSIGNVWLGFDRKGVVMLSAYSLKNGDYDFEQIGTESGLDNITVSSMLEDNKGNLWLGTNGRGVFKYSKGVIRNYRYHNGLGSNVILSIIQDRSGNLWFGTSGGGVVRFSDEIFTYFYETPGLSNGNIFAICEDGNKNIWVGTSSDGVFRYNSNAKVGEQVKHFTPKDGLAGNNVRAIIKDRYNNMWFATESGASKYNGSYFINYSTKTGLPTDQIRSLMEDKDGNIWLGTYGKGLLKYNGSSFINYTSKDGLNHDYIHSMYADSRGDLWFGTGAGVNKYDGEEFTSYNTKDGFCNTYVGSITEDSYGNMYFGTDRCIMVYDGEAFTPLTESDGLMSNTIYLLSKDQEGNIWAGTNKGVDKIFIDEDGEIEWIKNYGKEQGFTGIECNTRSVCMDSNGNLWFGTVKGVVEYDPAEDFSNEVETITNITGIKLFLEDKDLFQYSQGSSFWYKLPNELVLPHDKNHLTFEFIGINLKTPEQTQYEYMLEGFDDAWSPLTYKTEATYSNIPAGDYVFKVKSVNTDGLWNEEAASFSFEIEQPFWKKWWFYILVLSGLGLAVYSIIYNRTKQLTDMRQRLEELVAIRTEEITRQKDEKELLLKEIHHRVKNNLQVINSLLSIQSSYIDDENVLSVFKKSQDRIKSMSLIHEKMYQSSDLAHIDITEYINLLAGNLISSYSIDKHISLDLQISVEKLSIDTLIPMGLVINELITNSIKYAFEGRTAGKISVFLGTTEDRNYKLIVSDNGQGIKSGASIDKPSTMGMELVRILVEQIDGTIERRPQKGTSFLIVFKGIGKDKLI